ncbi:hypothetical protein LPJ54_006358, partial [Coemansia sp. RSA 1824]
MLAGSHVDLHTMSDVEWLRKHLDWLCGYRVKLIQSGRAAVMKHEFVSAGDQTMGLRFISMRVEQVRVRIDELNSKTAAVQEPKQPSALTTSDLQTYVTKLRDLQYMVSQATNAQPVHIVTQYIEQTRNYCAGVLAKMGLPGQGMKVVAGLVAKHDMAVKHGVGAQEASVEVNRAVRELYAEVKATSVVSVAKPVTDDVVMAPVLPVVQPVVMHKQHHPATSLSTARLLTQQQIPVTSQSVVQPIVQSQQQHMPTVSLSIAAPSLSIVQPISQQQIPVTSLSTAQSLTQQQMPATSIYSQALTLQQIPTALSAAQSLTQQQMPTTSVYSPSALPSATVTTSPILSAPMLCTQPYQQLPQTSTVRSASYNHLPLSTSPSELVQHVSGISMAPMSAHVMGSLPMPT